MKKNIQVSEYTYARLVRLIKEWEQESFLLGGYQKYDINRVIVRLIDESPDNRAKYLIMLYDYARKHCNGDVELAKLELELNMELKDKFRNNK